MYKHKIPRSTTPTGSIPSIRNLSRIVSRSLSFRKRTAAEKNKNAIDDTSTICEESSVDGCSSVEVNVTSKISQPDVLLNNATRTEDGANMRSKVRESESRDTVPNNNALVRFTVDPKVTFDDMSIADSTVCGFSSVDVESTISGNSTNVEKQKGRRRWDRDAPRNIVPVRCHGKSKLSSDFCPLLLISTLTKVHEGPIWCTAFNKDGMFFATAGMDGVLQIWDVAPLHIQQNETGGECLSPDKLDGTFSTPPPSTVKFTGPTKGTEIRMLSSQPCRRFTDHTKDIVNLSWSHSDFLLSASLDKTVRLWHPTKRDCLKKFRHADALTSVSFHPTDDRYFLSGGFDKKLRMWSVPDGRVKDWVQTSEVITAAEYQPDGELIAVGLLDGKVNIYNIDGGIRMTYHTQILCKNRRSDVGEKVTGLAFRKELNNDNKKAQLNKSMRQFLKGNFRINKRNEHKAYQLLVTTNDSRVRLVGLNDLRILRKYKGVQNSCLQIESHMSESGDFIAIGSDSRNCTIWNTTAKPMYVNVTDINKYDKVGCRETFEVTKTEAVTDTIFVPGKSTKRGIVASGIFPALSERHRIHHDLSSAAIITSDYEGTIRIFIRQSCIDSAGKSF